MSSRWCKNICGKKDTKIVIKMLSSIRIFLFTFITWYTFLYFFLGCSLFDNVNWAVTVFLNAILINFLPSHKQHSPRHCRVYLARKNKNKARHNPFALDPHSHTASNFQHSQWELLLLLWWKRYSRVYLHVSKLLDFCVCGENIWCSSTRRLGQHSYF